MAYIFPVLPSLNIREKSYAFWHDGFSNTELDKVISHL
jgi:hypothetical protein